MRVAVLVDVVCCRRFEVMPGLGVEPGVVVLEDVGEAVGLLALVEELVEELEERRDADAYDGSSRLDFTEPNLAFASTWTDSGQLELHTSLDLEFSPPWRRQSRSGDPFVVTCELSPDSILKAAAEWAAEIKPYPPIHSARPGHADQFVILTVVLGPASTARPGPGWRTVSRGPTFISGVTRAPAPP